MHRKWDLNLQSLVIPYYFLQDLWWPTTYIAWFIILKIKFPLRDGLQAYDEWWLIITYVHSLLQTMSLPRFLAQNLYRPTMLKFWKSVSNLHCCSASLLHHIRDARTCSTNDVLNYVNISPRKYKYFVSATDIIYSACYSFVSSNLSYDVTFPKTV